FAELSAKGAEVTLEGVLADVQARDARDSTRAEAPLKPAEDAELMDTSTMDIETAVARAIELVAARR
ncbi:MAG TPA: cytidylate kinase, partial [Sulfitobacter pontiacus]|nr:cytidylate kinase [Sulfitobacter pontiacus]